MYKGVDVETNICNDIVYGLCLNINDGLGSD